MGFLDEFKRLAHLIAECVKGADVRDEVVKFRADYTDMKYCFSDKDLDGAMEQFCKATGL